MKVKINIIDPDSIDSDELIRRAQNLHDLSVESGIDNIFQPGLVKEIYSNKIGMR
jgi:hypothetical protein